jgi:hypothetical protein
MKNKLAFGYLTLLAALPGPLAAQAATDSTGVSLLSGVSRKLEQAGGGTGTGKVLASTGWSGSLSGTNSTGGFLQFNVNTGQDMPCGLYANGQTIFYHPGSPHSVGLSGSIPNNTAFALGCGGSSYSVSIFASNSSATLATAGLEDDKRVTGPQWETYSTACQWNPAAGVIAAGKTYTSAYANIVFFSGASGGTTYCRYSEAFYQGTCVEVATPDWFDTGYEDKSCFPNIG